MSERLGSYRNRALQSEPGNKAIEGALKANFTMTGLVDELGLVDEMKPGNFRPVSTFSAADEI
jgi:hypothetical protein